MHHHPLLPSCYFICEHGRLVTMKIFPTTYSQQSSHHLSMDSSCRCTGRITSATTLTWWPCFWNLITIKKWLSDTSSCNKEFISTCIQPLSSSQSPNVLSNAISICKPPRMITNLWIPYSPSHCHWIILANA